MEERGYMLSDNKTPDFYKACLEDSLRWHGIKSTCLSFQKAFVKQAGCGHSLPVIQHLRGPGRRIALSCRSVIAR